MTNSHWFVILKHRLYELNSTFCYMGSSVMFDLLFIKVINVLYSDSGSVNKLFHPMVRSCIRSPQTVIMTPDDYSPELQLLAWRLSKEDDEVYKQINLSTGPSASISPFTLDSKPQLMEQSNLHIQDGTTWVKHPTPNENRMCQRIFVNTFGLNHWALTHKQGKCGGRVEEWQRMEILQIVWWWRALCRVLICWKSPVITCAQTAPPSQSYTLCVLLIDALCSWGFICPVGYVQTYTQSKTQSTDGCCLTRFPLSFSACLICLFLEGNCFINYYVYSSCFPNVTDYWASFLQYRRKCIRVENWSCDRS